MVKIAVAGGSGVAREVVDALVAAKKHEITILSRNKAPAGESMPGISWRVVDYSNKNNLIEVLQGIHTVLSFVQVLADKDNVSQKNLIDASIAAGVQRFAPSEYGSAGKDDIFFWAGKAEVQKYLEKVNENGKVLEYTLFQPGLFSGYLASPYQTTNHVAVLGTFIDFENRRAIVVDGHDDAVVTLTTVQDLARVVAQAVELDGEWPKIGGIRGSRVTVSQILKIGEKIRGRPFTIDTVKLEDLEAGNFNASWILGKSHKAATVDNVDQQAEILKGVLIAILISSVKGAWDVSDAFNQLLPDYQFTQIEDFLAEVWEGKP